MSDGELIIDYLGESYTVSPSETFTFGRSADLCVDDNEYMHRITGSFHFEGGRWWLSNTGSRSRIEIFDQATRSKAVLAPKKDQVLPGGENVIRFSAGTTAYEFVATSPEVHVEDRATLAPDLEIEPTVVTRDVPLSDRQELLILALAEPELRDPLGKPPVPATKAVMARIHWTKKQVERTLDQVCKKFTTAGVRGLHATTGGLARDRRQILVDHCISAGIVTEHMLPRLDAPES